jgi:hypothetical protein
MAQENKELLLIDLSARLPYDPIVYVDENLPRLKLGAATRVWEYVAVDKPCKPYLRPMSSMTKEEFESLKEYSGLKYEQLDLESYQNGTYKCLDFYLSEVPSYVVILVFDWLNAHHFDYRGLIEEGLAIEALEGMYNIIK